TLTDFTCHSTIPEQMRLFEALFGPYGHFKQWKTKKGSVHATVGLDLGSFAWLLDLGDCIPSLALTNDENFFAFLGGYSDAEGRMGLDSEVAMFKLASCDKVILHQIHERLMELDIKFPGPAMILSAGYVDKRGIRCNRDFWRLCSQRKETLLALFERLGPYLRHRHKIEGMKAAIRNIEERNTRLERAQHRKQRLRELDKSKGDLLCRFPEEADLIGYLHDGEDLFQWEIGEMIGCSATTVGRKLKRYGIKTRTRSEAKKVVCGYRLRS
ncbi:MAG: hypothetical protein KKA73_31490, partial [Chloroflexi bacterium]|nr:hypothetical protein [Chloroflexota bacterium]